MQSVKTCEVNLNKSNINRHYIWCREFISHPVKSKFTSNDSHLHTGLKLYGILISAWTWNDKQFASSFDTNFIVWYNVQF